MGRRAGGRGGVRRRLSHTARAGRARISPLLLGRFASHRGSCRRRLPQYVLAPDGHRLHPGRRHPHHAGGQRLHWIQVWCRGRDRPGVHVQDRIERSGRSRHVPAERSASGAAAADRWASAALRRGGRMVARARLAFRRLRRGRQLACWSIRKRRNASRHAIRLPTSTIRRPDRQRQPPKS